MSHTYFCTDKHGNVYHRYSDGHATPQYAFAVVTRSAGSTKPVSKASVNYSRRMETALSVASRFQGMTVNRTYDPETGKWRDDPHRLEAEVVPVRAYRGRHKTEPKPENT